MDHLDNIHVPEASPFFETFLSLIPSRRPTLLVHFPADTVQNRHLPAFPPCGTVYQCFGTRYDGRAADARSTTINSDLQCIVDSLVQPRTGLLRCALETAEGLLWPARGLLTRDMRGQFWTLLDFTAVSRFPAGSTNANIFCAKRAAKYSGTRGCSRGDGSPARLLRRPAEAAKLKESSASNAPAPRLPPCLGLDRDCVPSVANFLH